MVGTLAPVGKVIEGMIIRLTFDGSIQRAGLCKKNVSEEKRKEFRKSLELILPKYLNKILSCKRYSYNDHYKILTDQN